MSWDLSIQDLPQDVRRASEIPDDFRPRPLGYRSEVIARIHQILPDVDFSDPTCGRWERPDFSMEFNMGANEICDGFMLHLSGGGSAMETVAQLLEGLRVRGIDCQAGEFFSIEAARSNFRSWQDYRNRDIGQPDENPDV